MTNIYEDLQRQEAYALDSHSRDLVRETYGAAKMARRLRVITEIEFGELNEKLITKGINDPAHCRLE